MEDLKETVQKILYENYAMSIKGSKENLENIIKWTKSKFNERKKSDVVNEIFNYLKSDENVLKEYIAGTYTERNGYGTHYYFYKENDESYLIKQGNDIEVFQLVDRRETTK